MDDIICGEIDALIEMAYGRKSLNAKLDDATKVLTILLMDSIRNQRSSWEKLDFKNVLKYYGFDLSDSNFETVLTGALQMVSLIFGCSFNIFANAFQKINDSFVKDELSRLNLKCNLALVKNDSEANAIYIIQRSNLANNHYLFDAFVLNYKDWNFASKPKDMKKSSWYGFENSGFARLETRTLLSELVDEKVLTYRLRPVLNVDDLEHVPNYY